jgi:small subunit ribosomal protein S8e
LSGLYINALPGNVYKPIRAYTIYAALVADGSNMSTTWHLRPRKKTTGGRLSRVRKKKKTDRGMLFLETRVGKRQVKMKRVRGGGTKLKLLSVDMINVSDSRGRVKRSKLLSVKENDANPHYIRRNILTRGAVVETEAGLARVTSRPGQQGMVNAVLIDEKS